MKVRIAIASATVFLQCRAAEPPPVVVPPPPPPAPVDAPIATAPAPPSAPSRAVVFAGAGTIANAAWVASGVVAVTRTEVWRFTPDKPHLVQITPLAGALNAHEVIAATTASSLVAVALDDSSVDIVDDSGHKVTLPAPPSPTDIVSLRFSPDQQTIAVTRTVLWKEATTFYDVASGKQLGSSSPSDHRPSSRGARRTDPRCLRVRLEKAASLGITTLSEAQDLLPVLVAGRLRCG